MEEAAIVILSAVQVERVCDRFAKDIRFEQDGRHMTMIRDVAMCTSVPQIGHRNRSNGRDVTVTRCSHNERQFRINGTRKVSQMRALVPES